MKQYKLQKGTISTIATDDAGIKAAQAAGYVLLGECDEAYNIIDNMTNKGRRSEQPSAEVE